MQVMFTTGLTRKCLGLARIVAGWHGCLALKDEAHTHLERTCFYILPGD